jgi:eukaryotic-like serine/threonine-protein kinase
MQLSIPQIAQMSRLLDEALPLDAAERRDWLEKLSSEYRDLAPALRRVLLPADGQGADPAVLPKFASVETKDMAASGLEPGARVGPYELIRPLGAGGMAEVWLARRADGAFRREVALKLPNLKGPRQDLEQRFARERDILASLEHPQIARFYDAGIDGKGTPYFAMEYVQGQPLTSWCDAHHLGISARLQLFLQVLEAVQFAHEKHVIHRDLKPSNILVTEPGQVRLLDFGVAKLLEADEAEHTQLTSVYGRALTPDYASPELLRGDAVDARSDLYSLGVLLYELLTGTRPYRLKSAASMGMLEQAIATIEVKPPSMQIEPIAVAPRAITPDNLARQLRGDLDAMVLKALAKQPEERYSTAAAFLEDLRRYLAGKPIQARPAGFTYRLRKFVKRNRTVVAVSTAAIAALFVMVGYTLYREAAYQVKVTAKAVAVSAPAIAPSASNPDTAVVVVAAPPNSVAVLPFVNISGDTKQQYFSDGLTEELLNSLAQIDGLQVAARTSSFSFREHPDIADVAHKLNVATVLEGSVRRSGHTVRVTAKLVSAGTGFHLWSKTYDRDLGDVLKLQTEIATAVATALELTLLEDLGRKIELGRTRNPAAFDAYLRALGAYEFAHDAKGDETAIAAFSEAIHLDPNYALAFAGRSLAWQDHADLTYGAYAKGATIGEDGEKALADARQAVTLAPELAEGHLALHLLFQWALDFTNAKAEVERAVALAPGNADVLARYGRFAVLTGRTVVGIAAARRAVTLDPLNHLSHYRLGQSLLRARRYAEAVAAFSDVLVFDPQDPDSPGLRGLAYYGLGDFQHARVSCEAKLDDAASQWCLSLTYQRLARHPDAEAALAKLSAAGGDRWVYRRATIYAQWGNTSQALESLESAWRLRVPELRFLKADPLMDPLRKEPRFQAIERELKFPD